MRFMMAPPENSVTALIAEREQNLRRISYIHA